LEKFRIFQHEFGQSEYTLLGDSDSSLPVNPEVSLSCLERAFWNAALLPLNRKPQNRQGTKDVGEPTCLRVLQPSRPLIVFAPLAGSYRAEKAVVREENAVRAKRLTLQQRRDIFRSLVTTQDLGVMPVSQSRQTVMKQFEITDSQLRQIEDEGLEKEWPPLNEAVQEVG
jgi:hypothetical protein